MKIEDIKFSDDRASFIISDIKLYHINALRRTLLVDVPKMAIDKVEIHLWIAGQFREAGEAQRHAPRPERVRREGREERRPEFGRKLRELAMELRRAMEEGDEDRVAELRERIQELRRGAAERRGPPRERPGRGEGAERGERDRPDREARARGETERLRREINDMKKELRALKKLIERLLKEREKD